METTLRSVLELVRDDPSAIVDDSSFDKIIDTLHGACKVDDTFLSSLFQSVPNIEETILQLTVSMNSKAASFGIRLLGLCIRYQRLPYQQYTSLLKQLLSSTAPNIVCAVLGVLKMIVLECDGLYWLLEERLHILILNQLSTSSYFVSRIAENVVHQILVTCVENIIEEKSHASGHGLKESCKTCLDDLSVLSTAEDNHQSYNVSFAIIMRLASCIVGSSLSTEVLQYLFTNFWSLSKWWGGLTTCTSERCQLIVTFFETCIQNNCAILLKGMFADNSCILGHVASLCERDMTLVAMGLLRVAILLSSGTVKNQSCENGCENLCRLSLYPILVYLQNDDVILPREEQKVVILSIRQQMLGNTEKILLSALKNVSYIVKGHFGNDCLLALELCVTLLGTCSGIKIHPVVGSLPSSGRHKIISELLVMFSQVFSDAPNHLMPTSVTEQLASYLAELIQKRSLPLQVVCKGLYLIGQVLTNLLQTNVGVAGSESRCDLLSKIAESLQLCAMDVNWEIRDSCIELIDFMATKQVSDAVVQFLTDNKLCELLVTRGLVDEESCVKASTMLALSSVMTTPQLIEKFFQQKTSQLVDQVGVAQTILEHTDPSSNDATVRIAAWRAFNIIYKKNKMSLDKLNHPINSHVKTSFLQKLSTLLSLNITDDNWEIKIQVVEMLSLICQSLTKQWSAPEYALCCNGNSDTHCELLCAVNFFMVVKEAITNYNNLVRERAKTVMDLLETSLRCNHPKCHAHLVELSRLKDSECITEQEQTPHEIFLDVLQEILMAAKCEESELKLTDCY